MPRIKYLLVENGLKKLKTFYFIYFFGKSNFEEDGPQNYLVFQPMYQYFNWVSGVGNCIFSWESKRLSNENLDCLI